MIPNKPMRWAICALLSLALASCGGGGTFASSGGVGTGGTGISSGTVTGFGSVVVDGTAYSSATPQYFNGNDQEDAALAPSTAVQLGDQLRVQLDAQGNPSTVIIEPDLIGAVASLNNTPAANANGFTVNGVGVRVNNSPAAGPVTYYSGLAGYGDLSSGMQVEVHGAYGIDAGGAYIQATLIEQLPSSNPVTRITGVVSNLDSAAGTFQIGNTSVQFSASTTLVPTGASLANGQLVNVWSNVPANNGAIVAGAIRIRTLQGLSGSAQIGGLVSMLAGNHFQVSGVPIDASAPGLASALLALADGEYVVVQGQVDPTTGVVKASSIRPYTVQPSQVELRGTITAYVGPSNFLVRGVPVDASPASFSPSGTTAASLGNGVFVDIVGSIGSGTGNVVTASAVTVLNAPPDGSTVDYQGTVSNLDAAHGTFTLTWQHEGIPASSSVTLAPNVVYSNGTPSQLTDGANVEIEATNTSGGLLAYSVSFRNTGQSSGSGTTETSGVVYNYAAGASSFQINGLTITIPSNVSTNGVSNGVKAEVSFTTSSGQNVAQRISIDR
ncbi:hypothetical protein GALL_330450 [mine drainage metagenome]|uniref:DUF5666 domain-containing protein n=1 Tax=mine drainage metagenome TaxID=410659 RepID=A0A1J5QZH2_9ZZZZ